MHGQSTYSMWHLSNSLPDSHMVWLPVYCSIVCQIACPLDRQATSMRLHIQNSPAHLIRLQFICSMQLQIPDSDVFFMHGQPSSDTISQIRMRLASYPKFACLFDKWPIHLLHTQHISNCMPTWHIISLQASCNIILWICVPTWQMVSPPTSCVINSKLHIHLTHLTSPAPCIPNLNACLMHGQSNYSMRYQIPNYITTSQMVSHPSPCDIASQIHMLT